MEFLAGAIIPLVVSAFKNPSWDIRLKFGLALVLSLAVGGVLVFIDGGFTLAALAASSGQVLGYAQAFYILLLKQTGLNSKLEAIGQGGAGNVITVPVADDNLRVDTSLDAHIGFESDDV